MKRRYTPGDLQEVRRLLEYLEQHVDILEQRIDRLLLALEDCDPDPYLAMPYLKDTAETLLHIGGDDSEDEPVTYTEPVVYPDETPGEDSTVPSE